MGEKYFISKLDGEIQFYDLCLPENYVSNHKYPLVIILSTNQNSWFSHYFRYYKKEPVIFADISGRGFTMGNDVGEAAFFEALEDIIKNYSIDEDRIYLTGTSNGAYACWALAEKYPDIFAGIMPVSGGMYRDNLCNLYNIPIMNLSSKEEYLYDEAFCKPKKQLERLPRYTGILVESMKHWDLFMMMLKADNLSNLLLHKRIAYPNTIYFRTETNRQLKCYWITVHSITQGEKYAYVNAWIRDNQIYIRALHVTGLTIRIPPQIDKKSFGVHINGKLFSFYEEKCDVVHLYKTPQGYTLSYTAPAACKTRKGTGLIDVYRGPLVVAVSDLNDSELLKIANNYAHPKTGGIDPNIMVNYPICEVKKLEETQLIHNLILIDRVNGKKSDLASLNLNLPIIAKKRGFVYQGQMYEGDYCVLQVIPNPQNSEVSVLSIQGNGGNMSRFLFNRKLILPSYSNGLHPYLNQQALIYYNGTTHIISEWLDTKNIFGDEKCNSINKTYIN